MRNLQYVINLRIIKYYNTEWMQKLVYRKAFLKRWVLSLRLNFVSSLQDQISWGKEFHSRGYDREWFVSLHVPEIFCHNHRYTGPVITVSVSLPRRPRDFEFVWKTCNSWIQKEKEKKKWGYSSFYAPLLFGKVFIHEMFTLFKAR